MVVFWLDVAICQQWCKLLYY